MKKIVTLVLVAMLAVSCLFALAACNKPLANPDYDYVITGAFNGWGVPFTDESKTAIDEKYHMEAIAISDKRVASIKDQLVDVQYIYIVEHTVTDTGAGWDFGYALTEGAEVTKFDGNQAIKVIKTKYTEVEGIGAWEQNWLPDAGNTTFKSLTPDTLYMPPHSEKPAYENSGAWNENPAVLKAGTYYIVFVEFTDGTFGLGAIAK